MTTEELYEITREKIESGKITELAQLFNYIPKKTLADDLHSSHRHLTRISHLLHEVSLGDIYGLSKLIGVDMDLLFAICKNQLLLQKGEADKKEES